MNERSHSISVSYQAGGDPDRGGRLTYIFTVSVVRIRILLTLISLIAWTTSAEAQWRVEPGTASVSATGIEGNIHVRVNCEDSGHVVAVILSDGVGFRSGEVGVQWDDGSRDTFTFLNQTETLKGSSKEFVTRLRQRNTMRLWVATGNSEQVTDSISLVGSSRAIDSLPCSRPQLTDAEIRRILINRSLASYSGSCACPYSTDRAGRRCGRRSAYSKPGGASPLCYPRDVSDLAIEAYRARQ